MRSTILPLLVALLAAPAAQAAAVAPVLDQLLPNAAGKRMTVITVTYAPGEASGPHRHADTGFLYARVLKGHIRSQVEGAGAMRVYGEGEGWTEGPGAHHLVSANASASEPASLLVVFVADDGAVLTKPD